MINCLQIRKTFYKKYLLTSLKRVQSNGEFLQMEPKKQFVVLIKTERILLLLVKMVIIIKLTFLEKKEIAKLFLKKVSNEYFTFNRFFKKN